MQRLLFNILAGALVGIIVFTLFFLLFSFYFFFDRSSLIAVNWVPPALFLAIAFLSKRLSRRFVQTDYLNSNSLFFLHQFLKFLTIAAYAFSVALFALFLASSIRY